MSSRLSTAGLARMCARHPWRTFAVWIVIRALSVVAASGLGDALTFEGSFTNEPESVRADDLLTEPLEIRDGELVVRPGAGLGIEIDPEKLDRYRTDG